MSNIFGTSRFSGEIPRLPNHLLPPVAAQEAIDCDFTHGELRGLKAQFQLKTVTNAVKGLYTPDGLRYFTWTEDVNAVKSPQVDDTHDRIYYTTASDFRVTKSAYATISGGMPSQSYRVGVPKPTVAPTLTLSGTPNDALPISTTTVAFWYEYGGQKYQENTNVTLTTVTAFKVWTWTMPAKTATVAAVAASVGYYDADSGINHPSVAAVAEVPGTPTAAKPMFHIVMKDVAGLTLLEFTPTDSALVSAGQYHLSVAASGTAATITATANTDNIETRAYVFTIVNNYDEESAPSLPTLIDVPYGQPVNIGAMLPAQGEYCTFRALRVYRSNSTSTGSAIYQYALELPLNGGSDSILSGQLQEILPSTDWLPPSPALQGVCSIGNGILAAFKGNEVHFCEAYRGFAWPHAVPLPFNVVSIIPYGTGLLATTTAHPYLISGVTPDSMSASKIPAIQAGVAKNAIADIGGGIVYASNDGLVLVNGMNASLEFSQKLFTRDDWRARYGSMLGSLQLAAHDGYLIGYFENADGFVIRLDEAGGTCTKYTGRHSASFMLPQADQIYMAAGNIIYQFAGGTEGGFTWHSGEHVAAKPCCFAAGHIDCTGSITLSVYADGVLKFTRTLTAITEFRLPSGFLARKWSYKLVGTGTVRAVQIAASMEELSYV